MNLPGETVLTRVIDVLENGVGGLLRPWQIRRVERANAEARMNERLLLVQVETDIADLKTGRKRFDATGKLIACDVAPPVLLEGQKPVESELIDYPQPESLAVAQAAHSASRALEMQRAVNLKRIALFAEEEAEKLDREVKGAQQQDSGAPQPEVDVDWFAKWRIGAQEISKEEMQRLWGKLLSGEVARPGSYSLHTVDFLARMSSADADLLARAAPFVTSGGIVKVGDEFFASNGLKFADFLYLDDLGLISGTVGVGGIQFKLGRDDFHGRAISTLHAGKHALVFDMGETAKSPPQLSFEVLSLTRVGREILTLASIPINMDYLQKISDLGVSNGAEMVDLGLLLPDRQQILSLKTMAKKPASPSNVT